MWCKRRASALSLVGYSSREALSARETLTSTVSPLLACYASTNPLLSGSLFAFKRCFSAEKGTIIKATWQKLPRPPVSDITGVAVIDKTAYVFGSKLFAYDISAGKWGDKIKLNKGSIGGRAIAWTRDEIVFDSQRKLPPKGFTLNSLNLKTMEATNLCAVPLTTFKVAKSENPNRLWVLGESYQNTGNMSEEMPCHIAYWQRKDQADKNGEWFAQNQNTLNVTGPAPLEKKELHVTTVNNKLYIFSTSEDQASLEVRTFDPQTFTWALVSAAGPAPEPRIGSSISVLGNKIIMFGGHSQYLGVFRKHSSEVLCFDTDKNEWETVITNEPVKGRSGHQAINLGNNELLFIGGKNEFRKMPDALKLKFEF